MPHRQHQKPGDRTSYSTPTSPSATRATASSARGVGGIASLSPEARAHIARAGQAALDLSKTQDEITMLKAEVTKLRAICDEKDSELRQSQKKLAQLTNELEALQDSHRTEKEKLTAAAARERKTHDRSKEQLAAASAATKEKDDRISALEATLQARARTIAEKDSELERLQNDLASKESRPQDLQAQIDTLSRKLGAEMQAKDDALAALEKLKSKPIVDPGDSFEMFDLRDDEEWEGGALGDDIADFVADQAEQQRLQEEREAALREADAVRVRLEGAESQLATLRDDVADAQQTAAAKEEQRQEFEHVLGAAKKALATISNKLNQTQTVEMPNLLDRYGRLKTMIQKQRTRAHSRSTAQLVIGPVGMAFTVGALLLAASQLGGATLAANITLLSNNPYAMAFSGIMLGICLTLILVGVITKACTPLPLKSRKALRPRSKRLSLVSPRRTPVGPKASTTAVPLIRRARSSVN